MKNYQQRLAAPLQGGGGSRLALGTFGTGPSRVPTSAGTTLPATIKTAGPNITAASLGTPVATGNATVHQPFTITTGDFAASHNPGWFGGLKSYKRAHGDTHAVPVGKLDPQASSVTWTNAADLGTGTTNWDLGFSYVGADNSESVIVWPAALSNVNPGALMNLGTGSVTWATMKGDTSGDTTTPIADTGLKRLFYAGMSTEYQGNFDNSGNIKGSTSLLSKTPNTVALVTDAAIEFQWTGSGPYTVNIWYDNGTAGTNATVVYPTGSTVNLGHTTSAAPSYNETNVASGTNYYAVLSRSANGTVSLTVQKTQFTISAFAAFFADGGIVPAAAHAGAPMFTASGTGGGGSVNGGGTGHPLQ